MNNKGFTLVEILAVIVILGLIMGIATTGVLSAINTSKNKSEKIFVDKISTAIDSYLTQNGSSLPKKTDLIYEFKKCQKKGKEDTCSSVQAYELESITINDLITKNILIKEDAINPKNKKQCFKKQSPTIRIFKDSDYVYYYYLDLSGNNTDCEISQENAIINTLPAALKEQVTLP